MSELKITVKQPSLLEIVPLDSKLELIADGFRFLEGPVWHPRRKELIFSDIPADKLYCWDDEGVKVFRDPSHMANGNTLDQKGRLITCEHLTSRVTCMEQNGTLTVLASHYDDRPLNSPNDIVVARDGRIFFTDPNFGRQLEEIGGPRQQEQPFQGVYVIDPGSGKLKLVAQDFKNPNGLCLSNDESRLFINDSPRQHIRVFDIDSDGGLTGGQVWAKLDNVGKGVADGMKFDQQGNLFCCVLAACIYLIRMGFTWVSSICPHKLPTWPGEMRIFAVCIFVLPQTFLDYGLKCREFPL
ncbi:MAG: SMP-30/gluconolactonase/LRE family protein [Anaerolineaceae bacterium]|nr:SMP-30/gluconolactonase/LRE family protein [Anaerolineaceae bacterium]